MIERNTAALVLVYSLCFWSMIFLVGIMIQDHINSFYLFQECYTITSSRNTSRSALLVRLNDGMSTYFNRMCAERKEISIYLYNNTECDRPWIEIEYAQDACSDCCDLFWNLA